MILIRVHLRGFVEFRGCLVIHGPVRISLRQLDSQRRVRWVGVHRLLILLYSECDVAGFQAVLRLPGVIPRGGWGGWRDEFSADCGSVLGGGRFVIYSWLSQKSLPRDAHHRGAGRALHSIIIAEVSSAAADGRLPERFPLLFFCAVRFRQPHLNLDNPVFNRHFRACSIFI